MTGSDTPEDSPTSPASAGDQTWERELLSKVALAAIAEQRRARRWNIAFKFAFLAYLVLVLVLYLPHDWWSGEGGGRHTALVDVRGTIFDGGDASADRIVAGLRAAFEDEDTAGVILRINSPGGSPVQAGYVSDEILRLRAKYPDVPLYAVITDMAASGGYYVAVSADRIYANKASLVGSIGVLMNGFGFVEAMKKVGVERRLITAGAHKGLFDMFSPLPDDERAYLEGLIAGIHRQFIETVKKGRGDRLHGGDELFSGLFWTGERGVELGLVDGLASAGEVARDVIGEEDIVNFTPGRSLLERIADRVGAAAAHAVASDLGLEGPQLR